MVPAIPLGPRSFTPSPPWSEPIKASTLRVLGQPPGPPADAGVWRNPTREIHEIPCKKKNINFPKWSRIASHLSCLEIWSRSSCWTLRKTHIDLNHSFLMFSEPHGALPQPARSSNCWDIRSSQGPFWIRTPGPTKILSCLAAKPRYMVQSPSERWLNWLNQTKNWLFDG